MSYDNWKTTEPDKWIDWPCVKHKRQKPCNLCDDDEADYLEEWLEKHAGINCDLDQQEDL